MHTLIEAFKAEAAIEEINLRTLFKAIQGNLGHSNKELRDMSVVLLHNVYMNCGDDVHTVVGHCKNMRPIQSKEIKEQLSKLNKNFKSSLAKIFDEAESHDGSANVKETKETKALARQ
jgi:creatinine amidohydrolase/Fe(II)-dependent formamide hydrolase-like protein